MLPKQLTMSAFGPYQKVVTIDFESFMQDGLFLITGPTGAGKTMIFDAVMFALYGVSSGSERSSEQFRCDNASSEVATYVELEFLLHEQTYLIKRSPKYTLPNRKTPKMPTALLTMPDGKIVDGLKEVNGKVKELLGIDEKQFKQIAMIAQGEFTKLIYASSEEREKVLRNLFKTNDFGYLEEQLKLRVRDYKSQYDLLFNQRNLLVANLKLADGADLKQYFEKQKADVVLKDQEYHHLLKEHEQEKNALNLILINNQRLEHLNKLEQQQASYKAKKDYYQALKDLINDLKKAISLQHDYQNVAQSNNRMQHLKKESENLARALKKANLDLTKQTALYQELPVKQEERSKFILAIQKHTDLIKDVVAYQKDCQKQKQITKQLSIAKSHLAVLEDKQQKFQKLIDHDSKSIAKIDQLKAQYTTLNNEYKVIHQRKLELHQLNENYDHFIQSEDQCFDIREKYQKVEAQYLQEKEKYDHLEHLYRLSQAGILASSLEDNHPCPVCGSLDHPHLATMEKKIVFQEDLKKAKKYFDKYNNNRNDVYNQLMMKQKEIEVLKQQLDKESLRLKIDQELDRDVFTRILGTINIEESDILKKAQGLDDEIIYLNKLSKSVASYQKDLVVVEKEIKDYQTTLQGYHDELNLIKGRSSSYEHLKGLTESKLNAIIKTKQEELKTLEQLIKQIETKYQRLKEQVIQLHERHDSLESQFTDEKNNYQRLQSIYQKQLKELFVEENNFLELLKQVDTVELKEKEYNDYLVTYDSLEKQIKELKGELKEVSLVDIKVRQEKNEQQKIQLEELSQTINNQKAKLLQIETTIKNINKIDRQLNDSLTIYQRYQDLSDITSGKNSYRISFERYVLAAYFENILVYANSLLKRMSQGRYQLYRRDSRSKGTSKQGLELDVLDLESGILRDVRTLSGGESFKAALALALGLSKMIQSYAGGIELNTLFIDEGFGSLDSQSLDQAIDCLIDLQHDGKLIGIISHVSELKERIDHKIILKRINKETLISFE